MTSRDTRVHVGGDVVGQLVVGDHNITVWAEQSVVTVVAAQDRPLPVRRSEMVLLPRQRSRPIGRDHEVATIRNALAVGRLAQIYGPPGAGKSTVLRYAAGQLGRSNTVFLPAANRSPGDVLQDVFEACYDTAGYRPSPVELRRLLSGVDICLLLDDLELPYDRRDEFLDVLPDAEVVFTAQRRILWTDGQAFALSGLAWAPALELLTMAIKRPLDQTEQRVAAQLWQLAEGSPLLLIRAMAAAPPGPDGRARLPQPAELGELLPRLFGRLSAPARAIISVLAISDATVSGTLLTWLVGAPAGTLEELVAQGLVIDPDAVQLCPGVAAALPAELLPGPPQVAWLADRCSAAVPHLSPIQIYVHIPLLVGVIDAATRFGRPDLGARLAKAVAPRVACSGRLNAWQSVLDQGKVAAQRADDRPTLAYLTHEAGILALVTGQAAAAAAAIATAITLWQQLGQTAHVTLAHHAQTLLTGHTVPLGTQSPMFSGQPPTSTTAMRGQHAGSQTIRAAKSKNAAKGVTKTGVGVKIAVAVVATAAVAGGGYVITKAATTSSTPAADSTPTLSQAPGQSTAPPPKSTQQQRGVLPTSCPTDPYFGSFNGDISWIYQKAGDPTAFVCVYVKGQWQLTVGHVAGNEGLDVPGAQPIDIPGTDSAWIAPDVGQAGALGVNIGNRFLKIQFIGSNDDAIAAAKRVLGLS